MKITAVYEPIPGNPSNWIEIGDDKHEVIAEIKGTHYGLTWEETQRYANLFCAAEEMLEALKQVVRHGLNESTDGYDATLKIIWDAIEKAKGL